MFKRYFMVKLILFSILFFINTISICSQTGQNWIELEGKVVNKIMETPIYATILLESLPYGADNRVFKSDADSGIFSFKVVANTQYKMKVSAKGYMDVSQEIIIEPGLAPLFIEMIPNREGALLSLNINFDQGKARILEDSFQELDKMVRMLKEYPKMEIQLEGHTDFRGSPSANLRLSERRVEAVKKYLTSENISAKRIKTKAFGGTMPVSKESTEEAKLMNRRVEARILKTE